MSDTPPDDELAALLAPALAEALDFALQLAYAAGWSHAQGEAAIPVANQELAGRLAIAALAWQTRTWSPPAVPAWLSALISEDHSPPPWPDEGG